MEKVDMNDMSNTVRVLAIDPGNMKSAFVLLGGEDIVQFGIFENQRLRNEIKAKEHPFSADVLAIEMVASYGMGVGKDVFDTVCWVGRFIEAWDSQYNKVLRKSRWGPDPETTGKDGKFNGVCRHLCKNNTASDSNIRQAIIDRYPGTGGGKRPQIGTKTKPGPLYGISKDVWSALAVGLTYQDQVNL